MRNKVTFWTFENLNFGFVSDFDIRISDLLGYVVNKIGRHC